MPYREKIQCRLGMIDWQNHFVYLVLPVPGYRMVPEESIATAFCVYQWLGYAWGQALLQAELSVVAMPTVESKVTKQGFRWIQFRFDPLHGFAQVHGHTLQKHKKVLRRIADQLQVVPYKN